MTEPANTPEVAHMPLPDRRPAQPDDLYRFRIPTDVRLTPDGRLATFTLQVANRRRDGYRHSIWATPTDGSTAARQLTLGAGQDRHARPSPDGRTIAFLSDRRPIVEDEPDAPEEREDGTQIYLLPLDGGEARRLSDLPRGVEGFAWSPDGRRIVALSSSRGSSREEDARLRGRKLTLPRGAQATSDYRYIDRLQGMLNGVGFTYDKVAHLWVIDVETGSARRLTDGALPDS
ncbi:MAG TPA: hypothetical protein VIV06_07920, partial [Candidatus Limnocylindrales bacterium]